MGRIVVGVDGSALSKQALQWAASEAKRTGAVVEAMMVWDNPNRDMWIPHVQPRGDPLALTRQELERIVKGVLGDHPDVAVATLAVEGRAARVLVEAAKGAELLVVGNRGRGGFAGLLLGSVSSHCVSHAPCPVVVVRGKVLSI
jgi:nucleotide-binding universal stress UspA family protein